MPFRSCLAGPCQAHPAPSVGRRSVPANPSRPLACRSVALRGGPAEACLRFAVRSNPVRPLRCQIRLCLPCLSCRALPSHSVPMRPVAMLSCRYMPLPDWRCLPDPAFAGQAVPMEADAIRPRPSVPMAALARHTDPAVPRHCVAFQGYPFLPMLALGCPSAARQAVPADPMQPKPSLAHELQSGRDNPILAAPVPCSADLSGHGVPLLCSTVVAAAGHSCRATPLLAAAVRTSALLPFQFSPIRWDARPDDPAVARRGLPMRGCPFLPFRPRTLPRVAMRSCHSRPRHCHAQQADPAIASPDVAVRSHACPSIPAVAGHPFA